MAKQVFTILNFFIYICEFERILKTNVTNSGTMVEVMQL